MIWSAATVGLFVIASLLGVGVLNAPLMMYRTDYDVCVSSVPERECSSSALQVFKDSAHSDAEYLLGFIEFDDQGQLWDRNQMSAVLNELHKESARKDLLMVIFVHGWNHSAEPYDANIQSFRAVLSGLSRAENQISAVTGELPRLVAGVYLGWRGQSVTLPVAKELTFWERKETASKIGMAGDAAEVFIRLEQLRRTEDAITGWGGNRTRMVVVGHSFGANLVYSAISQGIPRGNISGRGPVGTVSDVNGIGDLVVLINPAIEASLFRSMSDMANDRSTYFSSQLPVFAILTSEDDYATKFALLLGRRVSTFFGKGRLTSRRNGVTGEYEVIDQQKADITSIGHFEPYRTHYLRAKTNSDLRKPDEAAVKTFLDASKSWEIDKPGSEIVFNGSVLERTLTSAGRNPYLVIQVDRSLIRDHNDIAGHSILSFIRQLILISSQSMDPDERRKGTDKLSASGQ